MKQIISLIFCFLTVFFSGNKNLLPKDKLQILNTVDTFYIADNDSSLYRIGIHEKKIKQIFRNYRDTTFGAIYVGIDGEGDGTLILNGNVPYLFIYSNDEDSTIIGYIFYFHKFHTKTGIHPGMTVGQLKRIYPECKVSISMEFDEESIYIPEEDISCNLEYNPGVRAGFYSDSTNVDNQETKNINPNAKIFSIYKN
jgi:hypothetical protein